MWAREGGRRGGREGGRGGGREEGGGRISRWQLTGEAWIGMPRQGSNSNAWIVAVQCTVLTVRQFLADLAVHVTEDAIAMLYVTKSVFKLKSMNENITL